MRRWNLDFGDMNDIFGQMERMFMQPLLHSGSQAMSGGERPFALDVYETDDNVVLEMAVPGMTPEQLDLSVEGRQLTVRGVLAEEREEEGGEGRNYWVRGISRGEFQRTVTIPAGVDAEQIQAKVDNGLLTVTMPKSTEAKARRIQIEGVNQNG